MSNFSKGIEHRKDRKEKDKARKDKLSSYFFDLSKATYTIMVVGLLVNVIQEQNFTNLVLDVAVVLGVILSITLAKIGNNILKK